VELRSRDPNERLMSLQEPAVTGVMRYHDTS